MQLRLQTEGSPDKVFWSASGKFFLEEEDAHIPILGFESGTTCIMGPLMDGAPEMTESCTWDDQRNACSVSS